MAKPRVLVILPTSRDLRNLGSDRIRSRYRIDFVGRDVENPGDLDVDDCLREIRAYIRKTGRPDGLVGDDDYPANLVAGLLTREWNLPGPSLRSLWLCQHKYYSRIAQSAVVPGAAPPFALIPLKRPIRAPLKFPFFVKPVKGYLSILSRKVSSSRALSSLIEEARHKLPYFLKPFKRVSELARLGEEFPAGGLNLIGEGLLSGHQATLEGYVLRGKAYLIDIVDSIFYRGTGSFRRFETPSRLPAKVQEDCFRIAARFMEAIGFNDGVFNVEFLYDPKTRAIKILEVNSRMASQFAGLTEALHGTNTYEILLDLSLGRRPRFRRFFGKARAAASFVLRRFKDALVARVPHADELRTIADKIPGTSFEVLVEQGRRLSSHFQQDDESYRYGLINVSGRDGSDVRRKFEACRAALPFRFTR
jgi:ATP-grasp domain-containing protein